MNVTILDHITKVLNSMFDFKLHLNRIKSKQSFILLMHKYPKLLQSNAVNIIFLVFFQYDSYVLLFNESVWLYTKFSSFIFLIQCVTIIMNIYIMIKNIVKYSIICFTCNRKEEYS